MHLVTVLYQATVKDADLRKGIRGGIYVHLVGSDNFYTEYDVRVSAYNSMGSGPTSPITPIMSAEDSKSFSPNTSYHLYYT